ncbi:MAG: RNA 2',3'-cyclic phosphodiesterase [Candidatus Aenigmatarchaeota archaeon]
MVRCFLAIFPIKEEILEKIETLKREINKFFIGKAVERENTHITISFLGEIDEKDVEKIIIKIQNVVSELKSTTAFLNGIKLIPSDYYIRVIALEVLGLEEISKKIEKYVGGDVKPPHLTLFRVKKIVDKKGLVDFCKKNSFLESFEVRDIKLMKSTLTKEGPIYEVIRSFQLI